jgi:hypothetical protein
MDKVREGRKKRERPFKKKLGVLVRLLTSQIYYGLCISICMIFGKTGTFHM